MIPEVITNYDDFTFYSGNTISSLFWIIEYNSNLIEINDITKYSIMRNECLDHPRDFKDRLNSGVYRIWTVIPYEKEW